MAVARASGALYKPATSQRRCTGEPLTRVGGTQRGGAHLHQSSEIALVHNLRLGDDLGKRSRGAAVPLRLQKRRAWVAGHVELLGGIENFWWRGPSVRWPGRMHPRWRHSATPPR